MFDLLAFSLSEIPDAAWGMVGVVATAVASVLAVRLRNKESELKRRDSFEQRLTASENAIQDALTENSSKHDKTQMILENGMKSLLAEIHTEVTMMKPQIQALMEFMNSYAGSPWGNREAINTFLERFENVVEAQNLIQHELNVVRRELDGHITWEERHKYSELEERLEELARGLANHKQEFADDKALRSHRTDIPE